MKKIGLDSEYEKLEAHTLYAVRNAEVLAEFTQLQRDVKSWCDNSDFAVRAMRVETLKSQQSIGKALIRRILDIQKKIRIAGIEETQKTILECIKKLVASEEAISRRAKDLWQSKIQNEKEIEHHLREVESLIAAFENVPADLEDLQLMQRALKKYKRGYERLSSLNVSWGDFETLATSIQKECTDEFGEEELPWPSDNVIGELVENEIRRREAESASWLTPIENQVKNLMTMSVTDANHLHQLASAPPIIVTESHARRAAQIVSKVEDRLDALKIEWLLEKFKELKPGSQKEFIALVQKLSNAD